MWNPLGRGSHEYGVSHRVADFHRIAGFKRILSLWERSENSYEFCYDFDGVVMNAESRVTLDTLRAVGSRARIVAVAGEDAIAVRLMEMGLTDDEEIEVIGFAPLGDPIEYRVRGYRVSLRKAEAARVEIEPLGP